MLLIHTLMKCMQQDACVRDDTIGMLHKGAMLDYEIRGKRLHTLYYRFARSAELFLAFCENR